MLLRTSQLLAVLCLALCFNTALAGLLTPLRRDGTPPPATTPAPTPTPTPTDGGDGGKTPSPAPAPTVSGAPPSNATIPSNGTAVSTLAPTPTALNTTGGLNQTLFNGKAVYLGVSNGETGRIKADDGFFFKSQSHRESFLRSLESPPVGPSQVSY